MKKYRKFKKYLAGIISLLLAFFLAYSMNIIIIDNLFNLSITIMSIVLGYKQIIIMYLMSNEKYNDLLLKNELFQNFKEKHRNSIKRIIVSLIVIFCVYIVNIPSIFYFRTVQVKSFTVVLLTLYTLIKLIEESDNLFNVYGSTYSKYMRNKSPEKYNKVLPLKQKGKDF